MFDRGPHKGVVARKPRPVGPLCALEKEGGFKRGDQRGMAFATSRLAAGHGYPRHDRGCLGRQPDTPISYPTATLW